MHHVINSQPLVVTLVAYLAIVKPGLSDPERVAIILFNIFQNFQKKVVSFIIHIPYSQNSKVDSNKKIDSTKH